MCRTPVKQDDAAASPQGSYTTTSATYSREGQSAGARRAIEVELLEESKSPSIPSTVPTASTASIVPSSVEESEHGSSAAAAAVDSGWPEDERETLPGWRRRSKRPSVAAPVASVASVASVAPEPDIEPRCEDPEEWVPTMVPPDLSAAEPEAATQSEVSDMQPHSFVSPPMEASEAIVDERAATVAEGPTIEISHIDDDQGLGGEELIGASSVSAQVVPIRAQNISGGEKPPAEVPETGHVTEPVPSLAHGSGVHWLLFAVAASAALWLSTRARPEPAKHEPVAARSLEPVPAVVQEPQPVAAQGLEPAPVIAEEAEAIEPMAMPSTSAPAPAPAPVASDAEPARLTAYKTVMASTPSAAGCRHRGDSSGKVPIVVEFGSDGRVQRTDAKGSFANPMTKQCIVSKFSTLSIPTILPAPIIITADIRLR